MRIPRLGGAASSGGGAALCVISLVLALSPSCARLPGPPTGVAVYAAPSTAPRTANGDCAWFADVRDGVLYFGQAAFWESFRRSGGDPRADLQASGPRRVGRFDLARERFLEPLDAGAGRGSGTWDVHAHPNGRVYFSTFFDVAGYATPAAAGAPAVRFEDLGTGLNELAPGPGDELLATRYASEGGGDGSVVRFGPDGELRAELALEAAPGERVLAKSLAYDPVRREVWVNTDRIDDAGALVGHDARVLDVEDGSQRLRIERPELQFVHFDRDGRGLLVWRDGSRLSLQRVEPGGAEGPDAGREVVLDRDFDAAHDFAQEARTTADGGALVTRWSGVVHRVDADGAAAHRLELPRRDPAGLYYSGFERGGRVCVTYCAGIRVVCGPAP